MTTKPSVAIICGFQGRGQGILKLTRGVNSLTITVPDGFYSNSQLQTEINNQLGVSANFSDLTLSVQPNTTAGLAGFWLYTSGASFYAEFIDPDFADWAGFRYASAGSFLGYNSGLIAGVQSVLSFTGTSCTKLGFGPGAPTFTRYFHRNSTQDAFGVPARPAYAFHDEIEWDQWIDSAFIAGAAAVFQRALRGRFLVDVGGFWFSFNQTWGFSTAGLCGTFPATFAEGSIDMRQNADTANATVRQVRLRFVRNQEAPA